MGDFNETVSLVIRKGSDKCLEIGHYCSDGMISFELETWYFSSRPVFYCEEFFCPPAVHHHIITTLCNN
jgi:hypothetical protein